MYNLVTLITFLAIVTIVSGAICAAVFLILPRVARRPRYSRKG